jgi:aminoglycoside phosphotransferase (APT) family kinase protein
VSDTQSAVSTPWRRDPLEIQAALTAWAQSFRGGPDATISDLRMPDSGMANDTVLFRLGGEALVARLAPHPESAYPTFPSYDLELQEKVMQTVRRRTAVPVPEVVHLERSDSWLGVPFLITREVEGVVASDSPPYLLDPAGWFLRGTPADWKRFEASTIDVMVQVHTIQGADEDLAFLRSDHPGDTPLERLLESLRSYYHWGREGRTVPILERAIDALSASMPDNDRGVLNWGDSRPGNIIYRDFQAAAVLDWEMSGVGPAEVDLAWTTFFQRFWAFMAQGAGLPAVPAMFHRDEAKAMYEARSGVRLDDLAWYEALAGLRFGIILTRMSLRSIAYGMQPPPESPDDLVMFAPLLEGLIAEL